MFLSERPVYDKFYSSQVFKENKALGSSFKFIIPIISKSTFLRKAESENVKGTVS